jgi:phosphoribosylanthranilate isomerase
MKGCKIKICGLFREADIEYVNEAKPDYIGFVFAESRRRVTPDLAERLRRRLEKGIVPVGVFTEAPCEEIAALYRNGVIDMAQLHGHEDEAYIAKLKDLSARGGRGAIPVIKALGAGDGATRISVSARISAAPGSADFLLLDSGAGSGRAFDWTGLRPLLSGAVPARTDLERSGFERSAPGRSGFERSVLERKPWFLAGGVGLHNIAEAAGLGPFGVDVSSGAETDGVKDRDKILRLVAQVRVF